MLIIMINNLYTANTGKINVRTFYSVYIKKQPYKVINVFVCLLDSSNYFTLFFKILQSLECNVVYISKCNCSATL